MRNLYLLRHGQPAFPGAQRLCLSRTDLPLSTLGHLQAVMLGRYFSEKEPLTVFHSGMTRTRDTAKYLAADIKEIPALQELDVGVWEALPFSQIRQQWPELYQARGKAPFDCLIPEGEAPAHCQKRGLLALKKLMEETDGDLAVVCHAGINRLILNSLLNGDPNAFLSIPQPYGCINHLVWDGNCFSVKEVGLLPQVSLDESLCIQLLKAAQTPPNVVAHCQGVVRKAMELCSGLGKKLDTDALLAAALLHDIARTEKNHAQLGAEWLKSIGYNDVASIIACHHDLPEEEENTLSEKTILYLADKYLQGDAEVTLEERFANRTAVLSDDAARAAHARRFAQAQRIERYFAKHRKEDPS